MESVSLNESEEKSPLEESSSKEESLEEVSPISLNSFSKSLSPKPKTTRKLPIPRGKKRIFKNMTSPKMSANKLKLVKLFELMYYKAYIVKKYNSNKRNKKTLSVDTKCFWNPIRAKLEKMDYIEAQEWVLSLSSDEEEEIMNLEKNEKNGYLKRLAIIPETKDPTIANILELALNMGLYKGYVEGTSDYIQKNINVNRNNWYNPHYPFKSIYDFISKQDVKDLSKAITNQDFREIKGYLDFYPNPPVTKHKTRPVLRKRAIGKNTVLTRKFSQNNVSL
jgi:hypothetical protein